MRQHVYRVNRDFEDMEVAEAREEIAKAVELLREAAPDTFLGRKTQEPFPSETERKPRRTD